MNTKKVFKKLFDSIEAGDLVHIKGTRLEGEVVKITLMEGLTIVYIDTGDPRLTKVYNVNKLELI